MRKTDIRRLRIIFDENMTGKITYTEYQHALEAFELSAETHFIGQKAGGKGYERFETTVLKRFTETLIGANISADELFNSCDEDQSGTISVEELKN